MLKNESQEQKKNQKLENIDQKLEMVQLKRVLGANIINA